MGALVYITDWYSAQEATGASFAVSMFPRPQVPSVSLPAAKFMSATGPRHAPWKCSELSAGALHVHVASKCTRQQPGAQRQPRIPPEETPQVPPWGACMFHSSKCSEATQSHIQKEPLQHSKHWCRTSCVTPELNVHQRCSGSQHFSMISSEKG